MTYRAHSRLVMSLSCGLAVLIILAASLTVRRGLFILKALSGPMPPESVEFAAWIDATIGRAFVALVIGALVVAVFYAAWAMRSNRIIRRRTTFKLFFSPASAFWWHFAPLAHLFFPFAIMDELLRASTGRLDWATLPMPSSVKANWGLFLLQILALVVMHYLPDNAHSLRHLIVANGFLLVTLLCWFCQFLTLAYIVEVVDHRIEHLADMSPLESRA